MAPQQLQGLEFVSHADLPFNTHFAHILHFDGLDRGQVFGGCILLEGGIRGIDDVAHIHKGDLGQLQHHAFRIDAGASGTLGHGLGNCPLNFRFCKVFSADGPCGIRGIPGSDGGLRGVKVYEIFFAKEFLFLGQAPAGLLSKK